MARFRSENPYQVIFSRRALDPQKWRGRNQGSHSLGRFTAVKFKGDSRQGVSFGVRVVDLAKDPCHMGSLARSTTKNQVAFFEKMADDA